MVSACPDPGGNRMKLLIIRHGESEADILDVHEGRADFPLTERGHRQAEAMSEYVSRHYHVDKIYCSTLQRAAQTARHLEPKTNAPLIFDEHLMEFNNGLIAGLKHSVAKEKYPEVKVPLHSSVYKQESALEFRYRGEYMLSRLLSENDDGSTAVVVTHGGMINQLYRSFFKMPVDSQFFFKTGDACIHEWLTNGNSRSVIRANYAPHNL